MNKSTIYLKSLISHRNFILSNPPLSQYDEGYIAGLRLSIELFELYFRKEVIKNGAEERSQTAC